MCRGRRNLAGLLLRPHDELHGLSLGQAAEARGVDVAMVDEHLSGTAERWLDVPLSSTHAAPLRWLVTRLPGSGCREAGMGKPRGWLF